MFKMASFFIYTGQKPLMLFINSNIHNALRQAIPSVNQAHQDQVGHELNWRHGLIHMVIHHAIILIDQVYFGSLKSREMNVGVSYCNSLIL